jgi:ABC-type Na+ efflux pump permease subunit
MAQQFQECVMKRSASLLVFATLAACASPAPAPQAEQVVEREVVITGGFGQADPGEARTKEAQDVAVAEIYKRDPTRALVEKVEAKVQVVAGLNYAFDITMTGGARFKVVVYRDLQNTLKVTSYEKVG